MKFLEKIEDIINQFILNLAAKIKASIPPVVYLPLEYIKKSPSILKHLLLSLLPILKNFIHSFIESINKKIKSTLGGITSFFIFFRSEEFKKDKKGFLIVKPIQKIMTNPITSLVAITLLFIIGISITKIIAVSSKIAEGIHQNVSRKIASVESGPELFFLEIKKHEFEIKIGGGEGGGHGGAAPAHHEITKKGNIKLFTSDESGKILLEEMEEMLNESLEAMDITVPTLPINEEENSKIEKRILTELNEGLFLFTNHRPIIKIELTFLSEERPAWYRLEDKLFSLKNLDLQLFLEDTHGNHQVYIDFTTLSTNRNVVLYLKDHEIEIRDRFSTNVEPILPHLPIEDEGRRIIKDKIRDELNEVLKKGEIEGKIDEVYIDFILTS